MQLDCDKDPVVVATKSESWFEQFCASAKLECTRIEEGTSRTPDYLLKISGETVVVEVKEIQRNAEEQRSDRLLVERGYGEVLGNTPGDRVRKKVNDSSGQIRALSQGIYPSILVLCDIAFGAGQVAGHLDPYNVRVGMYGLEQVHIALPKDRSVGPQVAGTSFGPKRKMTEQHNTSISAIGVLSTPKSDDIRLHVYHNRFAAVPLREQLLDPFGIPQFRLADEVVGVVADWVEINVRAS
jgi:hypothetical protein